MDTTNQVRLEVWHRDHNLDQKDNIQEIPAEAAVFGLFGIVDEEPVNCRYVGETTNLRESVREQFASPPTTGLRTFLHGPWIKILVCQLMPGSNERSRRQIRDSWLREYSPSCEDDGEYDLDRQTLEQNVS